MITVRRCAAEDCDLWIRLNREFMAFEIKDDELWGGADQANDEAFQRDFQYALDNPQKITLMMIESDGEIVGFANLPNIVSIWAHGRALIIDDLYIREKYRGHGFGREALDQIEKFAWAQGFARLQFQSEKTNPAARAFYESQGYSPAEMYFYVKYPEQ